MGLDQRAGWIKDNDDNKARKYKDGKPLSVHDLYNNSNVVSIDSGEEVTEFEWRKHSRLQEYMRIVWYKKNKGIGPPVSVMGDEFNCSNVYLTEEDIYALQTLILNQDLPEAEDGFFWGTEYQEEAMKENKMYDLKFCHDALAWLKEGKTVFYSSWW